LSVRIDADTKDLESGLDRSEKRVNSFGSAASTVVTVAAKVVSSSSGDRRQLARAVATR